jgi:hypothetical protein
MPILSTILLCLLLLMVLAVLYLLLVPIDMSVTGTLDGEGARARGTVTWGVAGFQAEQQKGDLRTAICLLGHPFWFSMPKEPKEPKEPKGDQQQVKKPQDRERTAEKNAEKGREENAATRRPATPDGGEVIATVQEAWPRITDLLLSTLRALEIRRISIDMTFGLDDAAGTGEVFGYLMALRGILSPLPRFSMAVTPVFGTVIFAGTFLGTLRLNHPGTLLVPAARLGLSRPVRRLIWAQRGSR